jgi:hypothetical protein
MDSMLKPKLSDDPHDILMVAPDAVRVAPEEASDPIRDMMRDRASKPHIHVGSDFTAGAAVPPVDTTFRATAVGDGRRSLGSRALRAFTALLLTACIGGAAVAWQHHGEAAQRLIAEWAPLFARSTSQPSEKTGLSVQPTLAAAQVDTASSPQPAPPPEPATEAAAPTAAAPTATAPPEQAPSLEMMARDLANAGQEIAVLKATVEQLKASQQQLVAMVSEKNSAQAVRPKKPAQPVQSAPPPRPVAALAPARRPMPPSSLPPRQAIAAPPLQMQTTPAPYAPRQAAPLPPTTAESLDDPELPYVPRPPMPLR